MAKKDIKFTLDTIDSRYSPVGTVKQLDSVFFHIKITENGVTKDLTGQTIKLFAIKEDKKIVEQTTKINITNQSEGLVEIELLNSAIQVPGFTYFELEISDSNGIISTADFILRVNKRVGSDEAIESTNEVSTLKKVEAYVAKAKVELEEFKKIQSEILATNGNVNTQEALRVDAENRRIQAEETRVEAEEKRKIELIDARRGEDGVDYDSLGESIRTQIRNINNILDNIKEFKIGSYTEAVLEANKNNKYFLFILKSDGFTKPIWHIGNGVFVDAVGAVIEESLDEKLIHNFTYKVKLTSENETVYVPVGSDSKYDMHIDWGDGSEETNFKGVGTLGSCNHTYTGSIGDVFTITLYGTEIPSLDFGTANRRAQNTLFTVENNTLENPIFLNFSQCPNLTKIGKTTFRNFKGTSISFKTCTSLTTIEEGFSKYLDKSRIQKFDFSDTKIEFLDDDLFEGISLGSMNKMFKSTKLKKIPESLPKALRNCTDFYYAFFGLTETLTIPDDLFSYVEVSINDVRNCFNGGSAASIAQLNGAAKKMYDVLTAKISSTNYAGCFSNNTLKNKEQVPTAWGGNMR